MESKNSFTNLETVQLETDDHQDQVWLLVHMRSYNANGHALNNIVLLTDVNIMCT